MLSAVTMDQIKKKSLINYLNSKGLLFVGSQVQWKILLKRTGTRHKVSQMDKSKLQKKGKTLTEFFFFFYRTNECISTNIFNLGIGGVILFYHWGSKSFYCPLSFSIRSLNTVLKLIIFIVKNITGLCLTFYKCLNRT